MAEINISNLGSGGGGTLTLTTTGTGGASTYVAGVLNIPVYQSALTNPVTGTGTATRVAFWDSASSVSSSANLYWDDSNSFLGVGTATPGARLQVNGTGLLTATAFAVKDSGGTNGFTVADNGNTFVRGVLTVTGSSASSAATLMGRTVSGEVASISVGTNLTLSGNTLSAAGGSPAGSTGQVQFNNAGAFAASSNLYWDNASLPGGQRLGIGTSTPASSMHIVGAGSTSGTTSFLVQNNSPTDLLRVDNSGVLTIGSSSSFSSIGSSQITSSSSLASSNIVLTPKGNGGIVYGAPPDGTATGGNARGQNAVDLCFARASASSVASGSGSCLIGGYANTASAQFSAVVGGAINTASAQYSAAIAAGSSSVSGSYSLVSGFSNTLSSDQSFVFGRSNTANSSATNSLVGGRNAVATLVSSQVFASGNISTDGDAQSMSWRYFAQITGTGIAELFTGLLSERAVIPSNRLWNVNLQVSAICSVVGNGVGITLGDSFVGAYQVGIKRLVNATTLVGTVQNVISAQSDTGMSTSAVTITANDTNEALRVQFTPPTTAGSTTVIRVVVTATATVAGY